MSLPFTHSDESDIRSDVITRFFRYVKIHTTSAENSPAIPSTKNQFDLARLLEEELRQLGCIDIEVDDHCVVLATLPANLPPSTASSVPIICFNAHLDTSPSEPGFNVHPIITRYTGQPIVFPNNLEMVLSQEEKRVLEHYKDEEFIHTDGTTLLGADDKAGIAEIMTALHFLADKPNFKHGMIKILFTPDEEVGHGAEAVDLTRVGAKFGYTVDGGEMGGFESECFNAASGKIEIQGYNVHPGSAYGIMRNSLRLLPEVLSLFPSETAPESTKGYDAYYHPTDIEGDVNRTCVHFIIRNFQVDKLDQQISTIRNGIENLQARHPAYKISVEFTKSYRNMREILDQYPYVTEIAKKAITSVGLIPQEHPIRGGTDGAQFSYRGMPTPNIFTGGFNMHSKKECIPIIAMVKAVETIIQIMNFTVLQFNSSSK